MEVVQPGGSSGGTGHTLTAETPVGAVNGSNTTFLVFHEPLFVVSDSLFRTAGNGYTYSLGTIEFDPTIPPVQWLISYYNA